MGPAQKRRESFIQRQFTGLEGRINPGAALVIFTGQHDSGYHQQGQGGGASAPTMLVDRLLCTIIKGLTNEAHEHVVIDVVNRVFDGN